MACPCSSLVILIVLSSCLIGQAQSGRHSSKPLSPPTSTAPTTPPNESEPTATTEKPVEKIAGKQQNVIVGMDDRSSAYYIQPYMADAVMRGFTEKFNGV